jgi:potassium efflux system protein
MVAGVVHLWSVQSPAQTLGHLRGASPDARVEVKTVTSMEQSPMIRLVHVWHRWGTRLVLVGAIALLALAFPLGSFAQDTAPRETIPLTLDGRELFDLGAISGFTAQERVDFAHQVLVDQVERFPLDQAIAVSIFKRGELTTLRVGGRHFLTLTEGDLIGGIPPEEQAELWQEWTKAALTQAQRERTPAYRRWAAGWMVGIVLVAALAHGGLRFGRRRLRAQTTRKAATAKTLPVQIGLSLAPVMVWAIALLAVTNLLPLLRRGRYQLFQFLSDTLGNPVVTLGTQDLSILSLAKLLILVLGLWLGVRTLTRLIRSRFLQALGANREVQDGISLILQIALVTLGLLVLLQVAGVDVSSLAIVASVLGVGIGFGLQNIANNVVSGMIILLERPIQVGDFIKLGDLTGTVERIGIRSTEISTLDRVSIIVPNTEFIQGKVINWNHGLPVSRLHVSLGVAYGSDIKQVRQVVLEAANLHPQVLRYPKPQLWFNGLGDSSLDFELLVWVREPRQQFRIRSDLYYLLEANLRRYNIKIPFPQRDLHVRSAEVPELLTALGATPDSQRVASEAAPAAPPELTEFLDWSAICQSSDPLSATELQILVSQMRGTNGVEIRDRRFGLHVYARCFVGTEAVEWLMQTQLASREEAIRLGQTLMEQGLLHHVTDEHFFKDDYLFYRFYADEVD